MVNKIPETTTNIKPFLRWAGGKRWLIKHIEGINELKVKNYFEPFLGGGSVFFNLNNYKKAYLSDLNPDLIETYNCIKNNVDEVIRKLQYFKNTELQYYKVRETIYDNEIDRAAKFIYLNKTSYNGIYRVNKQGQYNVPYGFRRKDIDIVDAENLRIISTKLQSVKIICQDFGDISKVIKKRDLIFLDPPYTVAHEHNGFIQYNQNIFSLEDQIRLSKLIELIKEKDAYYILTNAKHKAILEIYNNIEKPFVLSRNSTVGGNGARREEFKEYIFSNCIKLKK